MTQFSCFVDPRQPLIGEGLDESDEFGSSVGGVLIGNVARKDSQPGE